MPTQTTTLATLRDRIVTLVEALTPDTLAADKFRLFRNEGDADFISAMVAKPDMAFRRFQVRAEPGVSEPEQPVSNVDYNEHVVEFTLTVAYPQTARTGGTAARARDATMDDDFHKIKYAIGVHSRGSFSGSSDCTPLGCDSPSRVSEGAVDFLIFPARFIYLRVAT